MTIQEHIDCVMPKSSKQLFGHFHPFTDHDKNSNYAPPVKYLAACWTSNWCFSDVQAFF